MSIVMSSIEAIYPMYTQYISIYPKQTLLLQSPFIPGKAYTGINNKCCSGKTLISFLIHNTISRYRFFPLFESNETVKNRISKSSNVCSNWFTTKVTFYLGICPVFFMLSSLYFFYSVLDVPFLWFHTASTLSDDPWHSTPRLTNWIHPRRPGLIFIGEDDDDDSTAKSIMNEVMKPPRFGLQPVQCGEYTTQRTQNFGARFAPIQEVWQMIRK